MPRELRLFSNLWQLVKPYSHMKPAAHMLATATVVLFGSACGPPAVSSPPEPTFTPSITAGSFVSVSAGERHTCGVKADGSVECWGSNSGGQATPSDGSFVSVSAGGHHTCGLKTDGSIDCWGSNTNFVGTFRGQAAPPDGTFVSVSAGFRHTCGVKTDGVVECWGSMALISRPLPTILSSPSAQQVSTLAE